MNHHIWRTDHCGSLRKEDLSREVVLSGWVHRRRDHGGLIFIDLRDRYGMTQIVFDPQIDSKAHQEADSLRSEWVVCIKGKVILRKEGMVNPKLSTGEIEVEGVSLQVVSQANTPPFSLCEEDEKANEELCLTYRYLDMRRGKLLHNFSFRHKLFLLIRQEMDRQNFVEVNTPILAKSTPEGARDYLVPSRLYPGHFYALPQSPQVFKQVLMIGGLDRYFQLSPCFRDEDLRADRQPEFTQLDMEMSFSHPEELFGMIEQLLVHIFQEMIGMQVSFPFLRMTYAECMEKYGTDKPDLRFGMSFVSLTEIVKRSSFSVFLNQIEAGGIVKGICVKGGADLSRKEIEEYTQFVGRFGLKGLAWMKRQGEGLQSNIVKFFPSEVQQELIESMQVEPGDLIFMVAEEEKKVHQALDHLRRRLAADRELIGENDYRFLWVTDFPLFSWNREKRRWQSEHHPFTSPCEEDIPLVKGGGTEQDWEEVRSLSYDIVLNGYELGSGSQRIHDRFLQKRIFQILNLTEEEIREKFGFFIEALQYGTPPHLGIALGLERLLMILLRTDNIRDVVSFPKTNRATDLMSDAPSSVEEQHLQELRLLVQKKASVQ